MQTKLDGVIENSRSPSYLHIVRIKPQAHHYEETGEPEKHWLRHHPEPVSLQ